MFNKYLRVRGAGRDHTEVCFGSLDSGPRVRAVIAAVSAASLVTLVAGCGPEAQREAVPVLRVMGPTDGSDQHAQATQRCSDTSGGKYRLEYDVSAKQTDDQRLQLARRIMGGDSSFDIMGLGVAWTPEFTETGWAPPLPEDVAKRITEDILSGPLDMATQQDQLYGAPLSTNTQLLWYRESLVNGPPETWDDLIASGERLADKDKPSMIGVQAAQYEGSVVRLNSIAASANDQLVAPGGQSVTITNNNATERTLDIVRHVTTVKGHDPSISQSDENQARLAFGHGDTFAQADCPFVYAGAKEKAESGNQVAREIFGDMAWTTYPAMSEGTPARAVIDGLSLAVPSTSRYPELIFEATDYLRNEQNQLNNALKGGLPPTLTKLYTQATGDFKEEYPFYREIYEQLNTLEESDSAELTQEERTLLPSPRTAGMMARPKSPVYQSLSILMTSRISPLEDVDAKSLVGTLDKKLQAVVSSEGLVP